MRRSPVRRSISSRNRGWIEGLALLFVLLLALGSLAQCVALRGLPFLATPTPTRTPGPTPTPTVDFRATRVAEDLLTQEARRAAELGLPTPTPVSTVFVPVVSGGEAPSPTPTPTVRMTVQIPLPVVQLPGPATSTPTPTSSPTPVGIVPEATSPTPTEVPGSTGVPGTATPLPPTPTPTALPATPTPAPPVILTAVVQADAPVYVGPSTAYTQTTTLPAGQRILLRGRTASGEWVYTCCEANVDGWLRQVYVRIQDNPRPPDLPAEIDPNDPRRLQERPVAIAPARPLITPTPIPVNDYPLFRGDPAGRAQVDSAFLTPLRFAWPVPASAGRAMSSPAIVAGPAIFAASQDFHVYSFYKDAGNQRWRYRLPQVVEHAPAVQNINVYVVDLDGTVWALQDQGNRALELWSASLGTQPSGGINLWGAILFVPGADHTLYALERNDGRVRWRYTFSPAGNWHHYPVVGDQLVYAGDRILVALDVLQGTVVWQDDSLPGVAAPPVYDQPGVKALAEIYVADETGAVHAYDANTGRRLWDRPGLGRAVALALDETTLYVAGEGFLAGLDRVDGRILWTYTFLDRVVGGPIVGTGRVVLPLESGTVAVVDAFRGFLLDASLVIPARITDAAGASDGRLFIPAADGNLYAVQENRP